MKLSPKGETVKDWRPAIYEIEQATTAARHLLRNDKLEDAVIILQTIKELASQILTEIFYQLGREQNKP